MKILTKGIDVSVWQGQIDWQKVKNSGIDYAILRCGYGENIASQDDSQFIRNMTECEKVGMPFGVYLFSYATSVKEAKSEAEHVLRLIEGHKLQYPVYYDLEDGGTTGKCSKDLILEMAKTFVDTLESKGYYVGIYANTYWNNTYLTNEWYNTKARWVAQYASKCTYAGEYGMWQYSSKGKVNGIEGNVDMNYCYVDYPSIIKENNKNGYKSISKTEKPKTNNNSNFDQDVYEWQKAAIADGYKFPKYGADGLWGEECESVAEKAICKKSFIVGLYKNKNLTKWVQKKVGLKGKDVDGKYWNITRNAVKAYQKKKGIDADGIVGIQTYKTILGK